MMDVRILKYFLAIASEGSISKAATILHLTQPTLSRQLKELEEELKTTLVIRGSRAITLTESGRLLKKRAEEMINLLDKTYDEIAVPDETVKGDIYIGSAESDGIRLIAKVAKQLHLDYPHIRFQLFSGNADDVKDRLESGLIDFGIFIDPSDISQYQVITLPTTDTWALLMRRDSPLATKPVIRPEDFQNIPILCSSRHLVQSLFSRWLGQELSTCNIVATFNLLLNASLMVEEGLGYALCLDKLIYLSEDSPLCFRQLSPRMDCHIHLAWKPSQVFSKPAQLFLSYLQLNIDTSI